MHIYNMYIVYIYNIFIQIHTCKYVYTYTYIHTTRNIYVYIYILTYKNKKPKSNKMLIMQLSHIQFKGETHQIS